MELRRFAATTPARVPVSGARGSATAKETCSELERRFRLEDDLAMSDHDSNVSCLAHIGRAGPS